MYLTAPPGRPCQATVRVGEVLRTLGVTRTLTTLLGGSAVGAGVTEGLGVTVVDDDVSVGDRDSGSIECGEIVLLLAAVEVGGSMPVASSGQLLLVGPEHERIANERHGF